MKHVCRCLLFLLALLALQPGVPPVSAAQSHPDNRSESHKKNRPKHEKKPKVRHTKTVLKGRHGRHARKPA
jgi:hypothetical protein